jgi:predicted lipoprotein with Yx(FWY)xxD motif
MKWLLGVTVGVLGFGLAACGSGGGTKPAASQTQAGQTQAGGVAAVTVAQNPAQGAILADANGRTLYLFEKDKGTTSACTGACASIWPAFTAAAPSGGSGVDGASLGTATGQVADQVTYHGHLLYHFSGDTAPGDVKGVGIPSWYPVSPSGAKVDKDDDAPKTSGTSSSGYGY